MYLHGFDDKIYVCSLQNHEVFELISQGYVMLWICSVLLFLFTTYRNKDLQALQNGFRSPVDQFFSNAITSPSTYKSVSYFPQDYPWKCWVWSSHKVKCNLTPTCTDLLRSNDSRKILPLASVLVSKFRSTDYPYHYCWFQKNMWHFCLKGPSLHFEDVLMCVFNQLYLHCPGVSTPYLAQSFTYKVSGTYPKSVLVMRVG